MVGDAGGAEAPALGDTCGRASLRCTLPLVYRRRVCGCVFRGRKHAGFASGRFPKPGSVFSSLYQCVAAVSILLVLCALVQLLCCGCVVVFAVCAGWHLRCLMAVAGEAGVG